MFVDHPWLRMQAEKSPVVLTLEFRVLRSSRRKTLCSASVPHFMARRRHAAPGTLGKVTPIAKEL